VWFTLLAADNHWADLHKLLMDRKEHPEFETEAKKAKYRRFLLRSIRTLSITISTNVSKCCLSAFLEKTVLWLQNGVGFGSNIKSEELHMPMAVYD
jgi:hypothetical protein